MGKVSEFVYCAFCRIQRKAYTKKHVTWTNVFLSLLVATLTMLILWQSFNAKVMILFVSFLVMSEIFIQLRWRSSSVCPYCGFDPVVYLTDQPKAVEKVKATLDKRKNSPQLVLSAKNPFETLPKKVVPRTQKEVDPLLEGQPPGPAPALGGMGNPQNLSLSPKLGENQ